MPGTDIRPVESDADTGEDDGYAHYARKEEIARAAVLGGLITALCGHRFAPVRDPVRPRSAPGARSWRACCGPGRSWSRRPASRLR